MKNPSYIEQLISSLKTLPSVGQKSAQRMAFYLLQQDKNGAKNIAVALENALSKVICCQRCNTFSETDLCVICADNNRQQDIILVVENPADMFNLEQSHCYNGLYFVLMGRISPMEDLGLNNIAISQLIKRVSGNMVKEVIIATNFTAEGEATAYVISELLKDKSIKLSRIARGMPVGGELEYVDQGTLAQSVYERRSLTNINQ